MNKFNLTMSVLIAATVVFFGIGIVNKANYKVVEGDTVLVTYSIIDGENTYDSQSATVVPGSNENKIITDDVVLGLKAGDEVNFDTKLKEAVTIDEETKVKKGSKVTIEGEIASITPAAPVETTSEETSEATSEKSNEKETSEKSNEKETSEKSNEKETSEKSNEKASK